MMPARDVFANGKASPLRLPLDLRPHLLHRHHQQSNQSSATRTRSPNPSLGLYLTPLIRFASTLLTLGFNKMSSDLWYVAPQCFLSGLFLDKPPSSTSLTPSPRAGCQDKETIWLTFLSATARYMPSVSPFEDDFKRHRRMPRQSTAAPVDPVNRGLRYYTLNLTRLLTLCPALLRCDGLHISHRLHLLRRRLRHCQVWCWYLCHGCPPTRFDCQEYVTSAIIS